MKRQNMFCSLLLLVFLFCACPVPVSVDLHISANQKCNNKFK